MASQRTRRTLRQGLVAIAVLTTATLIPTPAAADPELPSNASEAVRQLAELSSKAEKLTEEYLYAKDQLNTRRADQKKAEKDLKAAEKKTEAATAKEGEFRGQVDKLAAASFQGARFNQLSALLVSDSPQDFLDQMSALDMLATDNKQHIDALSEVVAETTAAQREADGARERAATATKEATKIERDLAKRKADMDRQIARVQQRLDQLTADERGDLIGGGVTDHPPVPGSGIAVKALNSALTQQGKPYQWAAAGPGAYDCSGLVYWAYQQHGRTLPRSSREQATAGSPVSRGDLQAGDLLFFYSPISHVGIYTSGNNMVHAPQRGDVVKVASFGRMPLTAIRRISD